MAPSDTGGPLGAVIAASAKNPGLVVLACAGLAAAGAWALGEAPLDAIPDLSDVQVIVFTEWPGQSPDLVEDQVTYPISTGLLSAPKVRSVRGQSMFGMSFVYAIFEDGTDIYWARSRVLESLSSMSSRLPLGVTPTLGPDASGVGWVFQYALVDESGRLDLSELRSIQDYQLRFALESVPGVAEVAPVGGFVKQYQVRLDPERLRAFDLGPTEIAAAIRASNRDTSGRVLEIAGHEHVIRGRGYLRGIEDLELIPVGSLVGGTPVLLGQVADVAVGAAPRRGLSELDGKGEVVGAIVIMRHGENALRVIDRVKERIAELEPGLPKGVRIDVVYDRSELIEAAVQTLRSTLLHEMIVVSVVIFLFLLHARSALVPILTLPVAVLLAFLPMLGQGLTANIMSLGGIAVAIGAMVDGSIIVVENVHEKLEVWEAEGRPGRRSDVLIAAMQEVGPTIFFSLLVITVSFLPVFALEGAEGRLFAPLAYTKTYSMGFASVLAVTLTPALAALFVRGKIRRAEDNPLNRVLYAAYVPVVRWVVRRPVSVVAAAAVIVSFTVPAFLRLDREFMPPLHEGAILYMPTAPPGMSMTEASAVLQEMGRQLARFPEVDRVFGKMGRAETPTDPAPIGMAETTITLRPRSQWRPGMTYEKLLAELDEAVRFPGMPNLWWMPIQTRTEMLSTGVRSPLGVQVFGDRLETIEEAARQVEAALEGLVGTRSVFAERSTGGFYLDIQLRREDAARYGITVEDMNAVIASALGDEQVSVMVDGRERYPIGVAYAREFRDDPDKIGEVLIRTAAGAHIPLRDVANIEPKLGPPMVRSEDGRLVGFVFVDTDRPIVEYVEDAQRKVAQTVTLPPGVRLGWVGQFRAFERAKARLFLIAPVTLALIVLLLYLNTGSLVETLLVVALLPTALVGAVWLVFLLDFNLSVAVWVGMIALAGLDAETSVVMLLYLRLAHERFDREGRLKTAADLEAAIIDGAAKRLRPKLMTVMTTMIGLVPILFSTGAGADVMRRIAAPMIGGLASSFVLEMAVYPAVFALWKRRALPPART